MGKLASGNMMASYKYGENTVTGKDTLYTDNFIMYGSSRLGTKNAIHYDMKNAAAVKTRIISMQSGISTLGDKQYEFSDHLGNVHMTISDRNKRYCDVNNDWEYNEPDILTSTDYYPGGYQMPERKWNDNSITYWNAQLGQDTVIGYFEDFSTAVKEVQPTSPIDIFVNQYGGPTHNSMLYIEPAPTLGQQRVRVQSTSCTLGLWGVISVTAGVPVTIKYNVDIGTAGKINFLHGASGSTVVYTGKQTSVSGWDSVTITPTGPTLYFQLRANNCTNTYFYVNSISVRQGTTMRYISAFNITPLSLQLANDWQNMSGTESGNYYASNIDVETYTGGKRVKVTVLTNIGNYGILNNVPMTVIPGKQYTFRFKVDKGNFSHINFMYGQKDPSDPSYTWSGYVYTAYSNGWHEYTFTPTKSQLMVQIRPGTSGQGKYFYLEAVELLYKDGTIHYTLEQDTARYQFGFNGQLKDNEIYGEGNAYTAEFWEYDPRSIRRWNRDPVVKPWISPYHAFSNKLLTNIDPNGDDDGWVEDKETKSVTWDENINSLEEFNSSNYDKNKFSYLGQDYKLPTGGSLTVTEWNPIGNKEAFAIMIGVDYKGNSDVHYDWFQTFETNNPTASGTNPMGKIEQFSSEWIDAVVGKEISSNNPINSEFYANSSYQNSTFRDMPVRYGHDGKTTIWKAQTSLIIINDKSEYIRAVTFIWGFSINANGTIDIKNITITPNVSEFNQTGFENLPK